MRALEREHSRPDLQFGRVAFDILGPVPVGNVEVGARVLRPGRSVELVEATMRADGRDVLTARGWRIKRTALSTTPPAVPLTLPDVVVDGRADGYLGTVEWRPLRGHFAERGPAAVWMRLSAAVVNGELPSPLERLVAIADSGNGASSVLSSRKFWFINPELTISVHREPVGEWILLDAVTSMSEGGVGLATSVLSDLSGEVGRGAQSLYVAPR